VIDGTVQSNSDDEKGEDMTEEFEGKEVNEEFVNTGAKKVTEEDFQKVVENVEEIEAKFGLGPLKRFYDDFLLLIALVKDYWSGNYREIPYASIAAVVFTLIYVLSPIDLIPDFIPVIGLMDDAAVVALCLKMIEGDLKTYEAWKGDGSSAGD
jgi:uncharacterized membrane protein YkvA (DUF1232 family)